MTNRLTAVTFFEDSNGDRHATEADAAEAQRVINISAFLYSMTGSLAVAPMAHRLAKMPPEERRKLASLLDEKIEVADTKQGRYYTGGKVFGGRLEDSMAQARTVRPGNTISAAAATMQTARPAAKSPEPAPDFGSLEKDLDDAMSAGNGNREKQT